MASPEIPADGAEEARHLMALVDESPLLTLATGDLLFREGESCRGAYFVLEGELALTVLSGGQQLKVGSARSGQLLAISSVVTDSVYSYTVHASSESRLAFVTSEKLVLCLREHAGSCLATIQQLGAELLEISEKVVRPMKLQRRHAK